MASPTVSFSPSLQLAAWFDCVAAIVWKNTDDGWKEARWHCSILDRGLVGNEHLDLSDSRPEATSVAAG